MVVEEKQSKKTRMTSKTYGFVTKNNGKDKKHK